MNREKGERVDDQPHVSVIMANYNYGRYLGDAINSVIEQTYPRIEIIVVDDGSTDDSREILMSYGDQIHTIFKSNGGQGSCFNTGFAASSGAIICFLDADELFCPSKVSELFGIFQCHKYIGSCFHEISGFGDSGGSFPLGKMTRSGELDFRSDARKGRMPFIPTATSALSFRRSLLDQFLPVPEAQPIPIAEDNYLKWADLALAPTYFLADALAQQRIHGANWYTDRKDQLVYARSQIAAAARTRKCFFRPLSRWANKVFAGRLGAYWRQSIKDPVLQELIDAYFSDTTWREEALIRAMAWYTRFGAKDRLRALLRYRPI